MLIAEIRRKLSDIDDIDLEGLDTGKALSEFLSSRKEDLLTATRSKKVAVGKLVSLQRTNRLPRIDCSDPPRNPGSRPAALPPVASRG